MRKAIGGGVVLLAFTLLAACGSAGDTPPPTPDPTSAPTATRAEASYLEQVRALETELEAAFGSIGELLSRAYPVREVFLTAVVEADLDGVFESVLRQAELLDPADRFKADRQLYVHMLQDSYPLALESNRAVEDEDLSGAFLARARSGVNRGAFDLESSEAFCAPIVPENLLSTGQAPPCSRPADLPGGEYGITLYDIMRHYEVEFSPWVSSFPLAMLPDEFLGALLALNLEIEVVIAEALEAAEQLEPPDELLTDHQRLLQYFRENLELAQAITATAREQDIDKLRNGYFPQSGVVADTAIEAFQTSSDR